MSIVDRNRWITLSSGVALRVRPPRVNHLLELTAVMAELAELEGGQDDAETFQRFQELTRRAIDGLRPLVVDWRDIADPDDPKGARRMAFDPDRLGDALEESDLWEAIVQVRDQAAPGDDEKKASGSSSSGRSGSSAKGATGSATTRRRKRKGSTSRA